MALFQYKTASANSWTDIPREAYFGTRAGTFDIVRPKPLARDGNFRPCAAVGPTMIKLDSALMTACGMYWWQGHFANAAAEDDEFWLTARDPYTNLWAYYTGWLVRPVWERSRIGTGSTNTIWENVHIEVLNVEQVAGP